MLVIHADGTIATDADPGDGIPVLVYDPDTDDADDGAGSDDIGAGEDWGGWPDK